MSAFKVSKNKQNPVKKYQEYTTKLVQKGNHNSEKEKATASK